MDISVHDNWVYAHTVDCDRRRVVLHTVYPHVEPREFTDIVFEGVLAHHFEEQRMGDGPANVLFDVTETEPRYLFAEYSGLFERMKRYGWPLPKYDDPEDLPAKLTANGEKCYHVHGSVGLSGFVFATAVEFRRRDGRAMVG